MKKKALFSIVAILMALFVGAQAPILFFPSIDTINDVTTTTIAASASRQTGTGAWHAKLQVQHIDSTVWLNSDTGHYTTAQSLTTRIKDSLSAYTWYRVRFITYNFNYSDSAISAVHTARTKMAPQPVTIGTVTPLSILPKSGLRFTASAISQTGFAFAASNTFPYSTVTDTVWFSGLITDSLFFTNSGPGWLSPDVTVIVKGADGSVAYSNPIPGFYAPNNTAPSIVFDTATTTPNSAVIKLNVPSLGNVNGGCVVITKVTNSFGAIVLDTTQAITTTGPVTYGLPNLLSFTGHTGSSRIVNGINQADTAMFSFTTKNVPAPALNAIADTTEYEDRWKINIYVNTAATYDSSKMQVVYIYKNQNGSWILIDSVLTSITGSGSINFTKLNQPAGTTWMIKVQGKNIAGLLSNAVILNVHTKVYNAPTAPYVADLLTGSANGTSEIEATGFQFYINPGSSGDYAFVVRDITDNVVIDTTYLAHNANQNLAFASYTITNLNGGHAYSVTPITIVAGGIIAGNTLIQVLPSPNSYPIASGISKLNSVSPTTMLDVKGFGSGEGNPCRVTMHIDSAGVQDVRPSQLAPGTYSGDIELAFSFSNLTPGVQYKLRFDVEVIANGNTSTTYDYFSTDPATTTSIDEVTADEAIKTTDAIADNQRVRMLTLLGQTLTEGSYQNARQQVSGKGSVIMQLLDQNGNAIKLEDEKGRTVYGVLKSFQ